MTVNLAAAHLAAPSTRRLLREFVARRVRAADIEDVVQATLCDALASARSPLDPEDLRRWLLAIARFKVVDTHRAAARRAPEPGDVPAPAPPVEARSLARWAERQLPPGADRTLGWMMREAEGEKLEAIAAAERLPAERVRQRVSRLRRFMRERWIAELAAVAVLALVAAGAARAIFPRAALIAPEPSSEALALADSGLAGAWRLAAFTPSAPLSTARQAVLDRVQPALEIDFDGHTLVVMGASPPNPRSGLPASDGTLTRRYQAIYAGGGKIDLVDAAGQPLSLTYAWDSGALVVTALTGPWAGVARLQRTR